MKSDSSKFKNSFEYIKELIAEKKYSLAYKAINDYMQKYPDSIYGKCLYAKLMYLLGDNDTAEAILKGDQNINEDEFALFNLINIYVETGRYEEAYGYCMELEKRKIPTNVLRSVRDYEAFLESELLIAPAYNNGTTYFEKQINYYEENYARCIVQKYYKTLKLSNTYFDASIDIDNLFQKVKKCLENAKRHGQNELPMDAYYFDYPNVGVYRGNKANTLKVVTIIKTHKILTMYPICGREVDETIPLDTMDEYHHDKIKCLSGLERFNNRYKK